jgi:solute carrier family 25 (mitochondrial carnitine/acylcarnitine transporter), member 20/29
MHLPLTQADRLVSRAVTAGESPVWSRIRHFLGGSASGVALVLAGHPFDLIKVRLQTAAAGRYTGALHAVRETVRSEGVRALYKGASPPMVATGMINSLMFGLMGVCQERKKAWSGGAQLDVADIMQCGSLVGVVMAFVVTPMELVKAKLQVQYNARGQAAQYAGPVDCARQLYRARGIRGLYTGLVPTMMHRGSNWAYFGGYEFMKRRLAGTGGDAPSFFVRTLHAIAAGSFAGTSFWLACYPVDVVKNRMQAAPYGRYRSMDHCIHDMWQTEGLRAFGRGFVPCIVRSVPANAAAFLAFETAMSVLPK